MIKIQALRYLTFMAVPIKVELHLKQSHQLAIKQTRTLESLPARLNRTGASLARIRVSVHVKGVKRVKQIVSWVAKLVVRYHVSVHMKDVNHVNLVVKYHVSVHGKGANRANPHAKYHVSVLIKGANHVNLHVRSLVSVQYRGVNHANLHVS